VAILKKLENDSRPSKSTKTSLLSTLNTLKGIPILGNKMPLPLHCKYCKHHL